MWLIVGLGNPGREYAAHRHNVGFMVVDALAERTGAESFRAKFSGEIARTELRGEDALLLKPMTYMNLSGDSVQPCAAFFKIPVDRVVVIHDELDLPFGELRLKKGGGHAGHNGLRSLIQRMGADFGRIRMGIGRPPPTFRGDVADFVLSGFSAEERERLPKIVENGGKAVLDIAARGFDAAMKIRNTRPKKQVKRPAQGDPEGVEKGAGASGEPPAAAPAAAGVEPASAS